MVIFSHMRSLTSRPDSGEAIALATDAMSECSDKLKSSKPGKRHGGILGKRKRKRERAGMNERITTRRDSGQREVWRYETGLRIKRRGRETAPTEGGDYRRDSRGEALTFGLRDGGRRGDGAEGGAAWEGGVDPRHGNGVTHPGRGVDGSDGFI